MKQIDPISLFSDGTALKINVMSDVDGSIHTVYDQQLISLNSENPTSDGYFLQEAMTDDTQGMNADVFMKCKDYLIVMVITSEGQHSKTINC